MSGPFPQHLAEQAETRAASFGRVMGGLKAHMRESGESARIWWSIPEKIRMLAALTLDGKAANAKRIAGTRWPDLNEVERAALGVTLREIQRGLRDVAALH